MNDRKKYRLLIGLVVGLVLLNIALLAWIGPLKQGRIWRGAGDRRLYLAKQLDFTDTQRERYALLRDRYFAQRRSLNERIRPERRRFFQQLSDTARADTDLLKQAQSYHQQLAQLDVLTLRHFQQVAAICTPEQRKKLDKIISQIPSRDNLGSRRSAGREKK